LTAKREEKVKLIRVFALLVIAIAVAFNVASFASADPSPVTPTTPSLAPKNPTQEPWKPEGITPVPLTPEDTLENKPPSVNVPATVNRPVPPRGEFAPTPDHPGTWVPGPDVAPTAQDDKSSIWTGVTSFIGAMIAALLTVSLWSRKSLDTHANTTPTGAVELTESSEQPFRH